MKKADRYFYPAVFTYEDGQEIAVVFPDFDVATSGADEVEAFLNARECLGLTIWGYEDDGEGLPAATPVKDIQVKENERVMLIDVFMPSIRMANVNKAVNRTVTLPAWLNALALENDINFSQVLQDALRKQLNVQPS